MNKYKLILPDDHKPPWWRPGDPIEYDIIDGQHIYEFDIVEESLPKELVDRMHQCLECLTIEIVGMSEAIYDADLRDKRPVGVDLENATRMGCLIIEQKPVESEE
jgi:hypothetical protein